MGRGMENTHSPIYLVLEHDVTHVGFERILQYVMAPYVLRVESHVFVKHQRPISGNLSIPIIIKSLPSFSIPH